jgi:ABC-2 type transport system ATP-binding protein
MTAADSRAEGKTLLERFGLSEFARISVDKLSKGMAQKVQLATAVVNKPQLLILDEPFSGLDPVNQGLLEDEIIRAAKGGAAVVFSTHVMQHAERLCDRLLLLARGRKLFEGTQDEARATLPVEIRLATKQAPGGLPGVIDAQALGSTGAWQEWAVRLTPGYDPGDLLEHCTVQGFALRRFEQRRASLHEVFLHIVGGEAR